MGLVLATTVGLVHLDRALGARLQRPRLRPARAGRDDPRRHRPHRAAPHAGGSRTPTAERAPRRARPSGPANRIAPLAWPVAALTIPSSSGALFAHPRERQAASRSCSPPAAPAIAAAGTSPPTHVASRHPCLGGHLLTVYSGPAAERRRTRSSMASHRRRRAARAVPTRGKPGRRLPRAGSTPVRRHRRRPASGARARPARSRSAASSDPSAVAYIGDFDSGATATSLQTTNASEHRSRSAPGARTSASPTPSPADDEGDPQRFQSERAQHVRAARAVRLQPGRRERRLHGARAASRGCSCSGDVSDPFDADIAQLIANDAPSRRAYRSSATSRISTPRPTRSRRATPASRRRSRPRAPTPSCSAAGPAPARSRCGPSCTRCCRTPSCSRRARSRRRPSSRTSAPPRRARPT